MEGSRIEQLLTTVSPPGFVMEIRPGGGFFGRVRKKGYTTKQTAFEGPVTSLVVLGQVPSVGAF